MTDIARWSRLPDETPEEYRDSFRITERSGLFYVANKDWSEHGVHMTCTSREAAVRELAKLVELYREQQDTATYALRVNNMFWDAPTKCFGGVVYPLSKRPMTWSSREKVEAIIEFFQYGPRDNKGKFQYEKWSCVRGGVDMVKADYEIVRVSKHNPRAWNH